ncbi:hypothetical protein PIB30_077236 [Stylosanthes scabra]|uniref:Uncharacterized protein n=1 Tax=Stylosanthes scabra TaxID=79078 RepID=A0ABU6ZP64_9FABA|nr:hypothetical protein [Stylosanthes scabra]
MIVDTPVDMEDNRKLFKRAFLLYVQKCFILPTSAPNVTPRALPMKNSRDPLAQPLWIQYWKGDTLWKRMKQEKTNAAGLIKTAKMHAKKMSSSSSESEYVESESGSDDTFFEDESDSEETKSESLVQVEKTRKRGNNSASACDEGWSETLPLTQKTISEPIYPTQEVIDISSSSEDEHKPQPIKVVVLKIEDCLVTSPSSKLITEVLMSMGQELPPESQPDPSVPSFSVGKEFQIPLRT